MADPLRIGIVLSGTAPAMTLMSGAMLAFAECGVPIDVISTTGVGALVGMLYLAPKTGTPQQALRALPNLFVSDWLYRFVPINFKVFYKYGSFAEKFYELRKSLPKFPLEPDDPSPLKRFINDWVQLWATALTPASSETASKGFMSHVPLVEDLVNFDALQASLTPFYLNAFSLETRRLRIFKNKEITPEVYNGAQAMFMMFPPVRVGSHLIPPPQAPGTGEPPAPSDLLTTGATHDPTGLQAIWTMQTRDELWGVLALDPLTECFWREPTAAYDAFQLMLMNPILALQQLMFALYARSEQLLNQPNNTVPLRLPRLYVIPPDIKPADRPRILKWTHENAVALQEAGRVAALPLAIALADRSNPANLETKLAPYRYAARFLAPDSRSAQFLNAFRPAFSNFGAFIDGINTPRDHLSGCATRRGETCDCGYDARRQPGTAPEASR
jgi:predicted acylesterase/phospholipase RssA